MKLLGLLLLVYITLSNGEVILDGTAAPVAGFRPPAVPLVVFSPYMSIWSFSNNLTDDFTKFWAQDIMCLTAMVRIDTVAYRIMSAEPKAVKPLPQKSVVVWPTRTIYTFSGAGVDVTITFTTPAFTDDIASLSLPVTHIEFGAVSYDGKPHSVQFYYDNTAETAVAQTTESVTWDVVTGSALRILRVGTSAQNVLGAKGDRVKINWGYNYIASDATTVSSYSICNVDLARGSFAYRAPLPSIDTRKPRPANDNWPGLVFVWDLGQVTSAKSARVIFAYDEVKTMDFFGRQLDPLWHKNFATPTALLESSWTNYTTTLARAVKFDNDLVTKTTNAPGAGPYYATITSLAYRQTTGSTAFAWDAKTNDVLYFIKEISSDGDVSTVDVIYPAAPFFLYLNPELLRLLMVPVMLYGNNETNILYNLAWAPHHLGTWPICDIKPDQQEQMPMEESANLLAMVAGVAKAQGWNVSWLKKYMPLLATWADYLTASLPDPGNQLCTDDFEGPSPHNVNLAAKGVVGLASYSLLLNASGDSAGAATAWNNARRFAGNWVTMATANDHFKLQYDLGRETWSLKYNLLFQRVLGMDLFPDSVFDQELSFYMTKVQKFGIPLDNRAVFTKTDWLSWMAALSDDATYSSNIFKMIYDFADQSPSRWAFSDWYNTQNAQVVGFTARPVVGGLFAHMLLH